MTPHFKPDTAALLLIDFQVGTLQLARTTPGDEALRNAVILAKTAKVLGMPIVLTSSQEDRVQDRQMSALSASSRRHTKAESSVRGSLMRGRTSISQGCRGHGSTPADHGRDHH
jgi:nicotinamidase-related amidase